MAYECLISKLILPLWRFLRYSYKRIRRDTKMKSTQYHPWIAQQLDLSANFDQKYKKQLRHHIILYYIILYYIILYYIILYYIILYYYYWHFRDKEDPPMIDFLPRTCVLCIAFLCYVLSLVVELVNLSRLFALIIILYYIILYYIILYYIILYYIILYYIILYYIILYYIILYYIILYYIILYYIILYYIILYYIILYYIILYYIILYYIIYIILYYIILYYIILYYIILYGCKYCYVNRLGPQAKLSWTIIAITFEDVLK